MKRRRYRLAVVMALGGSLLAGPVLAQENIPALMQSNRESLQKAVETAYFSGVQKKLEEQDYQQIRKEAETLTSNAKQIRQSFPKGEKIAGKLEEHAGKAARAASQGKLPEVNVQLGEVAEYCAECHNAYRW